MKKTIALTAMLIISALGLACEEPAANKPANNAANNMAPVNKPADNMNKPAENKPAENMNKPAENMNKPANK